MKRGQAELAVAVVAVVVAGIIGLSLTDSMCSPFCNCIDGTDITDDPVFVNEWQNHTCDGDKCDSDYSLSCNGTTLVVGNEYDIWNCDYMLTNATYNNTACTLQYTYEGENYHGNDAMGIVACNIPLVFALGVLFLAGVGWVMFA